MWLIPRLKKNLSVSSRIPNLFCISAFLLVHARSSITACPKTETIYTPCDPTKGERKIISVTYLPENCICKRQEEEHIASCHCPHDKVKFTEPVCDVLRQEFSKEGRVQEWRDDLNKCVDVVKRVSYPHGKSDNQIKLQCSFLIKVQSYFSVCFSLQSKGTVHYFTL